MTWKIAVANTRNVALGAMGCLTLCGLLPMHAAWCQSETIALPPYRPGQSLRVMVLNGIASPTASKQVASNQLASTPPAASAQEEPTPAPNAGTIERRSTDSPAAVIQDVRQPVVADSVADSLANSVANSPARPAAVPQQRSGGDREQAERVTDDRPRRPEARFGGPQPPDNNRPQQPRGRRPAQQEDDRQDRAPDDRGPVRQRFGPPGMEPPRMDMPRNQFEPPRMDGRWMEQPSEEEPRHLIERPQWRDSESPRGPMEFRREERTIIDHPPMHDIDAILASPAINKILKLTEEKLELQAEIRIAELQHRHQRELQEMEMRRVMEELERKSMQMREMQEELERRHAPADEARDDAAREREMTERFKQQAEEIRIVADRQREEMKNMIADRDVKLKELGKQFDAQRKELEASRNELEALRAQRQELEHRTRFLDARIGELQQNAEKAERENKKDRQPKPEQQEKKKPAPEKDKPVKAKQADKESNT